MSQIQTPEELFLAYLSEIQTITNFYIQRINGNIAAQDPKSGDPEASREGHPSADPPGSGDGPSD